MRRTVINSDIKMLMAAYGITAKELGDFMGVSIATVSTQLAHVLTDKTRKRYMTAIGKLIRRG